ncbi:MAG TPA: TetR/AcrR family transcriptional regulator [Terracidiphilus sp.]|jgi:AcrR family transcriptional regulator
MARPRSLEAHEKILHAALALFGERGIEGTSMDAIAQAAKVGKATIYNHWPDKEALLLEVMLWVNGLNPETDPEKTDPDSGSLERDLTIVLSRRPPHKFEEARNRIMPAFIAYSATHHEFGEAWRNRVMEPGRQCIRRILRRAQRRGLLQPNLNLDASLAILLGPMLYQHIFQRYSRSRASIASHVAQTFCKAFARNCD